MIVLDTNVLSEGIRPSPSEAVVRWLAAQNPLAVWTTTVTQGEMLSGVEMLPAGKRRTSLADTIEKIFAEDLSGQVLPFDEEAARMYAKIMAGRRALARPISQADAMIAAVARSRDAVLATRNTKDFEQCGIRVINPWTA